MLYQKKKAERLLFPKDSRPGPGTANSALDMQHPPDLLNQYQIFKQDLCIIGMYIKI